MKTLRITLYVTPSGSFYRTKERQFWLCANHINRLFGLAFDRKRIRLTATGSRHTGAVKVTCVSTHPYRLALACAPGTRHYILHDTAQEFITATGLKLDNGTTFYVSVK